MNKRGIKGGPTEICRRSNSTGPSAKDFTTSALFVLHLCTYSTRSTFAGSIALDLHDCYDWLWRTAIATTLLFDCFDMLRCYLEKTSCATKFTQCAVHKWPKSPSSCLAIHGMSLRSSEINLPNGNPTEAAHGWHQPALWSVFSLVLPVAIAFQSFHLQPLKKDEREQFQWRSDAPMWVKFLVPGAKKRNIDDAGICWGAYLLKSRAFGCDPRLHHPTGPESQDNQDWIFYKLFTRWKIVLCWNEETNQNQSIHIKA